MLARQGVIDDRHASQILSAAAVVDANANTDTDTTATTNATNAMDDDDDPNSVRHRLLSNGIALLTDLG
jgi:hypothetical protein